MAERDTYLTCESCGIRFLFTAHEQRRPEACPGCTALDALVARCRGTVKWYNVRKGYGFLRGDDGQDVFVHASGLRSMAGGKLRQGQSVEYVIDQSERGPVAGEVARIVD